MSFSRVDSQRLITVSDCKKAPSHIKDALCRLNDIMIYKMYALAGALLRIKGRRQFFFVSPFLHLPNAYTRFLLLLVRLPSD